MVAVLAAAKLGVLAYMNVTLNGPAAKSVAVAPVQQPGPVPILQQARNAVLEENRALAAQPALAAEPVKDKAKEKEKAPDKAEPVISVQALKQRSEQLDRQEQALRSLEADLNTRTAKLAQLETTIKAMIDQANTLKDEKMRHLIDVYTNMKAKQAASVLETLDEGVAVKVLAGMKGRQAGEILTFVTAKKAAKLSEELTKFQVGPDLPKNP